MKAQDNKFKRKKILKASLETAAIIISIIAIGISYYTSKEALEINQTVLETTEKFESIRLIRELINQFNTKQIFIDVRTDIESCKPLYKSWSGSHSHDTLNIYLNFFESLAFLNEEGMIDIEAIDYFFGAYLVEASVHPHIRRYIKGFRKNNQTNAFVDFEKLSRKLIEGSSDRRNLANSYKNACSVLNK